MTDEEQYQQIAHLIETAPGFSSLRLTPDEQMWLAQVRAAIDGIDDVTNKLECNLVLGSMHHGPPLRRSYADRVMQCLFNALARLSQTAPASLRGSFLPAGNAFDALVAVGRVLATAKQRVLFLDPYAGTEILESFAIQAAEGLEIRILADALGVKAGLKSSVAAWTAQHKASRPVAARVSPAKSLHDRAIFVDDAAVWTLGQSFKDLAARSPTTITRLDSDTGALKTAAYQALWDNATPL